jgi:hypothetical protein
VDGREVCVLVGREVVRGLLSVMDWTGLERRICVSHGERMDTYYSMLGTCLAAREIQIHRTQT